VFRIYHLIMTQIIYGIHPVKEALKSSHLQIEKILIATQTPHPTLQSILDLARKREIPVTWTTPESLERMTKKGVHQNVVALSKKPLMKILEGFYPIGERKGQKPFFSSLMGSRTPKILESLIRTALGCGVHGIIISKDRSVGITQG